MQAADALGIEVGGAGSAGVLNISDAMLGYLSTVGNLVIGTQGDDGHAAVGAGSVVVNAIDFGVLTSAPMAIFGTSVTVAAGAGFMNPPVRARASPGMADRWLPEERDERKREVSRPGL